MIWRLTLFIIVARCSTAESPASANAPSKPAERPTATKSNATRVAFGNGTLALPDGWSEIKREPDRVTFRSTEGTEQATVSEMGFSSPPALADFKRLCQLRLQAEKQGSKDDAILDVTGPSDDGRHFTFIYSGGDKTDHRLFSGYMTLDGKTLTTIYVEGVGVTPQRHLASFKAFVSGYRSGR